ncbi:hypothetical protein HPB48_022497 [Haemaphysalis longicornis]|uniref:Uncharacterized protein n=1 Tax=Haemaphysalis longicornis TaxID=44386 RepID=A0A9J6FG68_HAELO|nr:hypothetical protein HPB48_022497 [Haemaphysalis longicornis]
MDGPRLSQSAKSIPGGERGAALLAPGGEREAPADFASAVAPLRRTLPCSVLDDFDLRTVEDGRSLRRHQACNRAALARANGMLEQAKQDLQASTRQEEELCDQVCISARDNRTGRVGCGEEDAENPNNHFKFDPLASDDEEAAAAPEAVNEQVQRSGNIDWAAHTGENIREVFVAEISLRGISQSQVGTVVCDNTANMTKAFDMGDTFMEHWTRTTPDPEDSEEESVDGTLAHATEEEESGPHQKSGRRRSSPFPWDRNLNVLATAGEIVHSDYALCFG